MKIHEKYITEKVAQKDLDIVDMANDLTSEIESTIENIIDDWERKGEFNAMNSSDIKKMVNLAIKRINLRKIM